MLCIFGKQTGEDRHQVAADCASAGAGTAEEGVVVQRIRVALAW